MGISFETDMAGIQSLMESETICWGEVNRLARDGDGRSYMSLDMPKMYNHQVAGGERCIIFEDEADDDTEHPKLINLMGRRIPFVVLSVDDDENVLICSRKKAQKHLKASMIQSLQTGTIYEGEVTGFSRFGGFVEVNGVSGHIRNSDLTNDHSDIREYLSIGDTIEVRCKEITPAGSITWDVLTKLHRTQPISHDFEPGIIVLGRVVRLQNFDRGVAVFVNLAVGIDALCPMPREVEVEDGSRVMVKIDTVTPGRKATDAPRIRGRIIRVC